MSVTENAPDRRWLVERTAWLYEPLRRFFDGREQRHESLRQQLNAARIPVTVDDYLARSAVLAVLVALTGGLVGVALAAWLAATGRLAGVVGIASAVGLAAALAAVPGLVAWYARYYRPRFRASDRARKLALMYPSGVTYMYALSRGGLDIADILRRLARDEATYGELSREAGLVVNQMDYLGRDFMQALREASEVTPSPVVGDFFSDLLSIVESGGSVEEYLADQREEAIQDARSVQAAYLERVELFAEVYVTLLIAGPLFALILLMVMGITGSSTLGQVNLIVYVGVPAASAAALLVLDQLGAPFRQTSLPSSDPRADRPAVPDDPDAAAYAQRKRRAKLLDRLRNPVALFTERPVRVLALSVPLAGLVTGLLVATGQVSPSLDALYDAPLRATALLFVVPFVAAVGPLVVFQERRQRRLAAIQQRFPDVLSSVASANRMGIRPAEALGLATERTDDVLASELHRVHNETVWFDDLRGALLRLARRSRTRIVTRTLRLVAEADRASGNLAETLSVAAEDARMQRDLAKARSRELSTYVVAAVISFLVYLAILLLINEFYFEQAVAVGQQTTVDSAALPVSLQSLDADGFRLAFVHSSLVQALFIGLMAGKLSTGRVAAGLKYSLGLAALTLLVFGVV
jgi:flagellar protein FlaJ